MDQSGFKFTGMAMNEEAGRTDSVFEGGGEEDGFQGDQEFVLDSIEWWIHCLLFTHDPKMFHNLVPLLPLVAPDTIPEHGRMATRLHTLGLWQIVLQQIGGRQTTHCKSDKRDDDDNNNDNDNERVLPKQSIWNEIETSLEGLKVCFLRHDANDWPQVEMRGNNRASLTPSNQNERSRPIKDLQRDDVFNSEFNKVMLLIKIQKLFSSFLDTLEEDRPSITSNSSETLLQLFQHQWDTLLSDFPNCWAEEENGSNVHPTHGPSMIWKETTDGDLVGSSSTSSLARVKQQIQSIVLDKKHPYSFHRLVCKFQTLLQAWCDTLSKPTFVRLGYRANYFGQSNRVAQVPSGQQQRQGRDDEVPAEINVNVEGGKNGPRNRPFCRTGSTNKEGATQVPTIASRSPARDELSFVSGVSKKHNSRPILPQKKIKRDDRKKLAPLPSFRSEPEPEPDTISVIDLWTDLYSDSDSDDSTPGMNCMKSVAERIKMERESPPSQHASTSRRRPREESRASPTKRTRRNEDGSTQRVRRKKAIRSPRERRREDKPSHKYSSGSHRSGPSSPIQMRIGGGTKRKRQR